MKRYVWTAAAVLFVNAYASGNPFALEENLQKIDNDQEVLLSELRKLAEARDNIDDMEDNIVASPTEEEPKQEEVVDDQPVKMADSEEQYNLANAIDELVGGSENTESKKSVKDEEERRAVAAYEKQRAERLAREAQAAAEAEAAQGKAAQEKAAAELKAQKEAQEREEERRAVAAYEKKRAEKLALEAKAAEEKARLEAEEKAKKEAEQKVASIDVEAEKIAAKEAGDADLSNAVKEMGGETTPVVEEKIAQVEQPQTAAPKTESSLGDIDLEAEQRAAKEAADAAYLEAVREMDQEEEY